MSPQAEKLTSDIPSIDVQASTAEQVCIEAWRASTLSWPRGAEA
jgi:hypothetical protein